MEGQRKTNWADESDEDWSDHEETVAPQSKTQAIVPDDQRNYLISRIQSSSFPLTMVIWNLPYQIKEYQLISELKISDKSKITFTKNSDSSFAGSGAIIAASLEDALLIADRANTIISGRPFYVRLQNSEKSYNNAYQNDRSYQGDRRYQGEKSNQGDRSYQGNNKGYQDRSYQDRSYQGDRGRRGGRRNARRGGRIQAYEEHVGPEKKASEYRPKTSGPSKITIAPSIDAPVQQIQIITRPKSNPFGEAKPVNTLVKDLEFEKKLEEIKEIPKEETKYKIKEISEKDTEKEKIPEIEPVPVIVQSSEVKEEVFHGKTEETFRGRGRRGERYRKKYPDARVEENRSYEEKQVYEFKKHGQRRENFESGRRDEGKRGDVQPGNWENFEEKPKTEGTAEEASQPIRKSSENLESERKPYEDFGNYKRNYQGGRRPHGDRRRNDDHGHYEVKRKYEEKNRPNEYKPRGNYDNRKPAKVLEPEKNLEVHKNEEQDVKYISKYENKKKLTKAWTNPDEAAEIIKKPKESKIEEEEKVTKLGSQYTKKKFQEPLN